MKKATPPISRNSAPARKSRFCSRGVFMCAPSWVIELLGLDARFLHDPAPFLRVGLDHGAKTLRAELHIATQAFLDRRIGEDPGDLGGQLLDDRLRRAGRHRDAEPAGRDEILEAGL